MGVFWVFEHPEISDKNVKLTIPCPYFSILPLTFNKYSVLIIK